MFPKNFLNDTDMIQQNLFHNSLLRMKLGSTTSILSQNNAKYAVETCRVPTPKKFKVCASAGKVMASVFWDSQGVIMVDYLEQGKTITGDYYASLLVKLRDAIKDKRRGKLRNGALLLQDNAPSHSSHVTVAAMNCCQILPIHRI